MALDSSTLKRLIEVALRRNSSVQGTRVFDVDANLTEIAGDYLTAAVSKVGRAQAVEFNRAKVTFTLTSSKAEYKIGSDILSKHPHLFNMQYLWLTSDPGYRIDVISFDAFSGWARGRTTTGRPQKATLHSADPLLLELSPIPDSAYTVVAHAKENITDLEEIPLQYHDVILAEAYKLVHAAASGGMAQALAAEGKFDMEGDVATGAAPSIALSSSTLGQENRLNRSDKFNVTGE